MKKYGTSNKILRDRSNTPEKTRGGIALRPRISKRLAQMITLQRTIGNRALHQALRRVETGPLDSSDRTELEKSPMSRHSAQPFPRASEVLGGIIGGGVGAAVGAGLGFAAGGPIGALVGGALGLAAGAVIGALAGQTSLSGPITNPAIQAAMQRAWTDSDAGNPANRHEEGGYILRRADGSLQIARWPRGAGASIAPPARDATGRYNGLEVLGEFHTHPNPSIDEAGRHWVQGPSPGDLAGIAAEHYPGDSYVISVDQIDVVHADGSTGTLGSRRDIIGN